MNEHRTVKRVYIAGSSKEVERACRMAKLLSTAGTEVVSGWMNRVGITEDIPNDPNASREELERRANENVMEVRSCDLLWLLAPSTYSLGAYFELGQADALKKVLIASGRILDLRASIFSTRAHREFEDDYEALAHICYVVRHGVSL